jgi:hypothetical protein
VLKKLHLKKLNNLLRGTALGTVEKPTIENPILPKCYNHKQNTWSIYAV